ncbi:hypothetical protein ACF0H5_024056 [Mactra antiquata]
MSALNLIFLTFSAILFTRINHVTSHGRLINPAQRSSAWRYGYNTPANYNDMENFCGGFARQHNTNNGQCGVCGDPFDATNKPNEDIGGTYVTGTITGNYVQGGQLNATVQLTAYHKGWFEFRLCRLSNPSTQEKVTQSCLNQNLLTVSGETTTRVMLNESFSYSGAGYYSVILQLPANINCQYCVLQWKYNTGNSHGCFPNGTCCIGCGPQENFVNCADIRINASSSTTTTQSSSSSSQSATMSALTSSTTVTSSTSSSTSSSTTTSTASQTTTTSTTEAPSSTSTTTVTSSTSPTTTSSTTTTTTTEAPTTTTTQGSSGYSAYVQCSDNLFCGVSTIHANTSGMQAWCCNNCGHNPPYCPASHCLCSTSN